MLLSASDRKRTTHRKARRAGKRIIEMELMDTLDDEGFNNLSDEDELAFYEIADYERSVAASRRASIIAGVNPDTNEGYTLDEFTAALNELYPLTLEESDMVHGTYWNIEYFADLAKEIRNGLFTTMVSDTSI